MIPRWSLGQWLLRVVIVLAPVGAMVASVPAGASLRVTLLVILVVLALLFAWFPASLAGVLVLLLPVAWWASAVDDPLHPSLLLATAALLACHVAALLAAYGPDRLPVDPVLVRLWVRRAVLVYLPVPVLWAVADVLAGEQERPALWVVGLVVACVGAIVPTVAFGARPHDDYVTPAL